MICSTGQSAWSRTKKSSSRAENAVVVTTISGRRNASACRSRRVPASSFGLGTASTRAGNPRSRKAFRKPRSPACRPTGRPIDRRQAGERCVGSAFFADRCLEIELPRFPATTRRRAAMHEVGPFAEIPISPATRRSTPACCRRHRRGNSCRAHGPVPAHGGEGGQPFVGPVVTGQHCEFHTRARYRRPAAFRARNASNPARRDSARARISRPSPSSLRRDRRKADAGAVSGWQGEGSEVALRPSDRPPPRR